MPDYCEFVSHTAENPFAPDAPPRKKWIPLTADSFFFCQWGGTPVCPAFLRWMNEPIPEDALNTAEKEEERRQAEAEAQWRSVLNVHGPSGEDSLQECGRNSVFALFLAFDALRTGFQWPVLIAFLSCCPFPVLSFFWYYGGRMKAELRVKAQKEAQEQANRVSQNRAALHERKTRFRLEIEQGLSSPLGASLRVASAFPNWRT